MILLLDIIKLFKMLFFKVLKFYNNKIVSNNSDNLFNQKIIQV